jgi:hypothetical protein
LAEGFSSSFFRGSAISGKEKHQQDFACGSLARAHWFSLPHPGQTEERGGGLFAFLDENKLPGIEE